MSQCEQILAVLKTGANLTPMSAYVQFGVLACHSRIAELRAQGYDIRCEIKRNGVKKWGSYRLIDTREA